VNGTSVLDDVRAANFERMIDLIFRAHPHYRSVFASMGLQPSDLASLPDLSRIPITTKADFVRDPEAFVLERETLADLTVPERTVWGAVYTSGTSSGFPTPFYDTAYDHAARIEQLIEVTANAGISPADTVANCFPLSAIPHQGFLSALYGPLGVGAKMLAGFTGAPSTPFAIYRTTDDLASAIAAQRATVIWGITSYVRRVIARAEAMSLDLSTVRLVFAAGEWCAPGMRHDLTRRLMSLGARDVQIQNGYGFTEMQGPTWQCADDGPFHIPAASRYLFEAVDPDTGNALPDGVRGRLLVSHLDRRGTVLLRYAMGDDAAYAEGPCETCGRDGPRIVGPITRSDSLLKIKGTLTDPQVLIDVVSRVPGVDDFRIEVRLDSTPQRQDELVVLYCGQNSDDCRYRIGVAVRAACEVRPVVSWTARAEFELDAEGYKFRRFADVRTR